MEHTLIPQRIRTTAAAVSAAIAAALLALALSACTPAKDWQSCEVQLEGGTGRATVQSPARIAMEGDSITARIQWSSPNYDLMVVQGEEYKPESTEGGSVFEIPIAALDEPVPVKAQTTAMSTPHMIDYTLTFDSSTLKEPQDSAEGALQGQASQPTTTLAAKFRNADTGCGWQSAGQVQLDYARNFTIDTFDNGCKLICTAAKERYLVVPEGFDESALAGIAQDIAIIRQPVQNVYLAATNTPCLLQAIGATDRVSMLSMRPDECAVQGFVDALKDGGMEFGGKYNAPDYERIVQKGCKLAIESTMINHTPEVKEKLQDLGITVLTELSSYEPHALGRLEWIKLHGTIFGLEEQAQAAFEEQAALSEEASASKTENPSVAFFYINSNGSAVTRMPGDYIAQMIGMAGGEYIFSGLSDVEGANSTVTLEMESFFAQARDADVIIYNATIDGGVENLSELIGKNPLLGEFKAVKYYNVWCTDADMYQQMIGTGEIVSEMNRIFAGTADNDMRFFKKLD